MKFILGRKIGMTQIFGVAGDVIPVTRVIAGPCQVTQVREDKRNGKTAVQLGFGEMKEKRADKSHIGHLKGLELSSVLKDFYVEKAIEAERGDEVTVKTFAVGDHVEVIGQSKGKGFAGVVKRHHFRGGPASHGHKDNLRAPGSIGAGGVQRVFKGMRMAGRMGGAQVTVKNLEIAGINAEANELLIKGAVPGGRNGILEIYGEGELKISKKDNKLEQASTEAKVMPESAGR